MCLFVSHSWAAVCPHHGVKSEHVGDLKGGRAHLQKLVIIDDCEKEDLESRRIVDADGDPEQDDNQIGMLFTVQFVQRIREVNTLCDRAPYGKIFVGNNTLKEGVHPCGKTEMISPN